MDEALEIEEEFISCCNEGKYHCVKLFVEQGVDVTVRDERAMLGACKYISDIRIIKLLYETGRFNDIDKYISYSLGSKNFKEKISFWLDKGANFTTDINSMYTNLIFNDFNWLDKLLLETNFKDVFKIDCMNFSRLIYRLGLDKFIYYFCDKINSIDKSVINEHMHYCNEYETFSYFIDYLDSDYLETVFSKQCSLNNINIRILKLLVDRGVEINSTNLLTIINNLIKNNGIEKFREFIETVEISKECREEVLDIISRGNPKFSEYVNILSNY